MSVETGSCVQEEAVKNKADRQRRRQVNTADEEEEEPPRLAVTEHRATRAITATTLHLIAAPPLLLLEGPCIMSPPVSGPHAFSTFHWTHTGAVTLN